MQIFSLLRFRESHPRCPDSPDLIGIFDFGISDIEVTST